MLGINSMADIVLVYQFKNTYKFNPSDIQLIHMISYIPVCLIIFYGIVLDTTKIGKSRRKGFILIAASV